MLGKQQHAQCAAFKAWWHLWIIQSCVFSMHAWILAIVSLISFDWMIWSWSGLEKIVCYSNKALLWKPWNRYCRTCNMTIIFIHVYPIYYLIRFIQVRCKGCWCLVVNTYQGKLPKLSLRPSRRALPMITTWGKSPLILFSGKYLPRKAVETLLEAIKTSFANDHDLG